MAKKKVMQEVEVDVEEVELKQPVICGHEEVRIDVKDGEEVKVFKCGAHGEHPLSDCQELCV